MNQPYNQDHISSRWPKKLKHEKALHGLKLYAWNEFEICEKGFDRRQSHLYRLTCQMGGVKYEPAAVDDDGAGGSFRQSRKMLNNSRMNSREEQ